MRRCTFRLSSFLAKRTRCQTQSPLPGYLAITEQLEGVTGDPPLNPHPNGGLSSGNRNDVKAKPRRSAECLYSLTENDRNACSGWSTQLLLAAVACRTLQSHDRTFQHGPLPASAAHHARKTPSACCPKFLPPSSNNTPIIRISSAAAVSQEVTGRRQIMMMSSTAPLL